MTNVKYREVKRKAAVGERIKVVVGGTHGDGHHNVGDILYVIYADRWSDGSGVSVSKRNYVADSWFAGTGINHGRYVVLEPIAEPAAPSPLQSDPLYAAFRQFVADNAPALRKVIDRVEAQVYGGKVPQAAEAPTSIAPKLTRAEVIAKAAADVAEITADLYGDGSRRSAFENYSACKCLGHTVAEFVVDREKRTVVALIKLRYSANAVRFRGIAKCAPDDVFHAEIGKAIALRRALGLAVPSEYTDAPKPEKAYVGAVVTDDFGYGVVTGYDGDRGIDVNGGPGCGGFWTYTDGDNGATTLDDTDVDYAVSTKGVAA